MQQSWPFVIGKKKKLAESPRWLVVWLHLLHARRTPCNYRDDGDSVPSSFSSACGQSRRNRAIGRESTVPLHRDTNTWDASSNQPGSDRSDFQKISCCSLFAMMEFVFVLGATEKTLHRFAPSQIIQSTFGCRVMTNEFSEFHSDIAIPMNQPKMEGGKENRFLRIAWSLKKYSWLLSDLGEQGENGNIGFATQSRESNGVRNKKNKNLLAWTINTHNQEGKEKHSKK